MLPASRSTLVCRRFRSAAGLTALALLTARASAETQLSGLTQVDWVIRRQSSQDEVDPSTRAPLNEDRVLLRRGRLAAESTQGLFGARLELDMNTLHGLTVRPFEALVFARYEQPRPAPQHFSVVASAGLMQIPFGFDALELDIARPVLERAQATRAFFGQAHDLGLGADLTYRFATLSLAMMNGEPLSDNRYAGLDLNRGKDFVGRAGVKHAWLEPDLGSGRNFVPFR